MCEVTSEGEIGDGVAQVMRRRPLAGLDRLLCIGEIVPTVPFRWRRRLVLYPNLYYPRSIIRRCGPGYRPSDVEVYGASSGHGYDGYMPVLSPFVEDVSQSTHS